MTPEDFVAAAQAWAEASAPELTGRSYDYVPGAKPKGLPDVVVELQQLAVVQEDPDFPFAALQQIPALRVASLELSIMAGVMPADPSSETAVDEAHEAASAHLRALAALLGDALVGEGGETLDGRVPLSSPFHVFDFTRPFVEYDDGTRGREVRMTIKLAEPLVTD